ncbi:MAG: hypothetical protein K2Y37_19785 [Pirellulales bacterium]|nr:hypothetical protein [Pirellulales bacterium]
MEQLRSDLGRARRRLFWHELLRVVPRFWTVALVVAVGAVLADRFYPLGIEPFGWVGGALILGTALAWLWALASRRNSIDAATEVDHRFGLQDTVATALSLSPAELQSAAGRAVLADAERRLHQIDVGEKFRVRPDRWCWLPLLPALALVGVLYAFPLAAESAASTAKREQEATRRQVQASARELQKRVAERRAKAKQEGLRTAEELLTRLERATECDLAAKPPAERQQALVKLNDLSKDIAERRRQLADSEQMQKQLDALKDLGSGPADKFAEALREGNLNAARQELEKLAKQLEQGELGADQREQLAQQLDNMRQKLADQEKAQQAAEQKLEQQMAAAEAAGNQAEAQKLAEQLERARQQGGPKGLNEKLAQRLEQAAKSLREGRAKDAEAAMAAMGEELGQLQGDMAEAELLDAAMDELADAKHSMSCKHCQGQGCGHCRGNGGGRDLAHREGGGRGGREWGTGHVDKPPPQAGIETQTYDSKVAQRAGQGAASVVDLVDGPQAKGRVTEEIAHQFEEAQAEAADPLTGQRLPRATQSHARQYFEALREGGVRSADDHPGEPEPAADDEPGEEAVEK